MLRKLERYIAKNNLQLNKFSKKEDLAINIKNVDDLARQLHKIKPDQTFDYLQMYKEQFFSGLKDRNGMSLWTHHREDCENLIDRMEFIAEKFKEKFQNTPLCDQTNQNDYPDDILKTITNFIFYEISPIIGEQKYKDQRSYPSWDNLGNQNQDINFFNKLMVHVFYTQVISELLVDKINEYIEQTNEKKVELLDSAFGYLKNEDGSYKKIQKNVFKARLLLHDLGRWVSHHGVLHEKVPEFILYFAGIDPRIIEHIFNHDMHYFSENVEDVNPENIPIEDVLFHFIDFIGKRNNEDKFEDKKIRALDQLAEHTIARASNYNGDLKEYLDRIKQKKEITVEAKIKTAIDILRNGKNSHEAQFYERELEFLRLITPYLNTILSPLNSNLQEMISKAEEEINHLEDTGGFILPPETDNNTSDAKKLFNTIKNSLNAVPNLFTRRFRTVGIKR